MSLFDALEGAATPPCDRGCEMRARCAAKELCCDAFRMYVHWGRAGSPYMVAENRKVTGELDYIDTTREKYLKMIGDEV